MSEDIDNIKIEIDKLHKEINDLKKENTRQNKAINSYQIYLDTLFQDFDLKPKGVLNYTHMLCQEILDFVDNVCKKYDLEWWMDYGNLLGAVRHKGFIPWDDDLDIGLMRKDCLKFREVIGDEVKRYGLNDIFKVSHQRRVRDDYIVGFTQLTVAYNKGLYGGIDIFAKDYCKTPMDNENYLKAKSLLHCNLIKGMDKKEAIEDMYSKFDFSFEKQDYFVPSMEGGWGKYVHFKLFETDKVFPLEKVEFRGKFYPCPKDTSYYLTKRYGENFMQIPRTIVKHGRLSRLKQQENVEKNYEIFIRRFKEANENFLL